MTTWQLSMRKHPQVNTSERAHHDNALPGVHVSALSTVPDEEHVCQPNASSICLVCEMPNARIDEPVEVS
jgi:hypothetical protein